MTKYKQGLSTKIEPMPAHLLGILLFWITPDVDPMLGYCWFSVTDAGSTLTQHCVSVSCQQGCYLGHVDKLLDDVCALLRRCLTEDHTLDPLGQPVKQSYGALQFGVLFQRRMDCIVLEVRELRQNKKKCHRNIKQL